MALTTLNNISNSLPSGSAIQVVNGVSPTQSFDGNQPTPSSSTEIRIASTTPAATGFYVLITPSSTNSKILVFGRVTTGVDYSSANAYWDIYRGIGGTTPSYVANISNKTSATSEYSNDLSIQSAPLMVYDTPNTTSQVRYEVYARSHSSSHGHYIYTNKSGQISYGITNLVAMEIKG